jgi:hypothetical protein
MKTIKTTEVLINASKWAFDYDSVYEAWEACERADVMLLLARSLRVDERKIYLCNAKIVEKTFYDSGKLVVDYSAFGRAVKAASEYGTGLINEEKLIEKIKEAEEILNTETSVLALFNYQAACGAYSYGLHKIVCMILDLSWEQHAKYAADICRKILTEDIVFAEKQ